MHGLYYVCRCFVFDFLLVSDFICMRCFCFRTQAHHHFFFFFWWNIPIVFWFPYAQNEGKRRNKSGLVTIRIFNWHATCERGDFARGEQPMLRSEHLLFAFKLALYSIKYIDEVRKTLGMLNECTAWSELSLFAFGHRGPFLTLRYNYCHELLYRVITILQHNQCAHYNL